MTIGCGKKQVEPQTDPTMSSEPTMPTETVDTNPVTPEEPADTTPAIDYSTVEPLAIGIEDVFFDFDKYDLNDEAMRTLSGNSRVLREHPQVVVMIEGHCDERGTVEYNLALGEKRALAVRDYLSSLGVPSKQLRTTSYGENKPFAVGHSETAWAQNRRAHFSRP